MRLDAASYCAVLQCVQRWGAITETQLHKLLCAAAAAATTELGHSHWSLSTQKLQLENKVAHEDDIILVSMSWYMTVLHVFSYNLATLFQLLSARNISQSLNMQRHHLTETQAGCEPEKNMCFCGCDGSCVVPGACIFAPPDSHGQSRGAIMNSQEGLFHWVLSADTLCWAWIQKQSNCLSLSAEEFECKKTVIEITEEIYVDFTENLTIWGVQRDEITMFYNKVDDSFCNTIINYLEMEKKHIANVI